MNKEVNFELAKLLKEKGLDIATKILYNDEGYKLNNGYYPDIHKEDIAAPTIAEVVMWLYEKHGIWATVYTMDKWLPNGNDREQLFDYSLKQMKLGLIDIPKKPEEFDSPTEAYETAILYTLNNLI